MQPHAGGFTAQFTHSPYALGARRRTANLPIYMVATAVMDGASDEEAEDEGEVDEAEGDTLRWDIVDTVVDGSTPENEG